MPQNPQKKPIQNALKNFNQFRSLRIEYLIWVQITTNTGMKTKAKTTENERYQKLLDFINIDVLKI